MQTLKSYRKNNQISQIELAQIVGVDQATVSRLETGEIMPSLELAIRIEDATGGCVLARNWSRKVTQ